MENNERYNLVKKILEENINRLDNETEKLRERLEDLEELFGEALSDMARSMTIDDIESNGNSAEKILKEKSKIELELLVKSQDLDELNDYWRWLDDREEDNEWIINLVLSKRFLELTQETY